MNWIALILIAVVFPMALILVVISEDIDEE